MSRRVCVRSTHTRPRRTCYSNLVNVIKTRRYTSINKYIFIYVCMYIGVCVSKYNMQTVVISMYIRFYDYPVIVDNMNYKIYYIYARDASQYPPHVY